MNRAAGQALYKLPLETVVLFTPDSAVNLVSECGSSYLYGRLQGTRRL